MNNSTSKKSIWEAYRFPIILLTSIIIGSVIGANNPEFGLKLKPFGDIFLNLMFTMVTPLVFFTIASSIASMSDLKRLGKILGNMLLVFVVTGAIASVVMLVVVSIKPPGVGAQIIDSGAIEEIAAFNTGDQIVEAITVNDFSLLFSKSHMLPLIVFAIFFGFTIASMGEKTAGIAKGLETISDVFLKMISYIMLYAPIGLGAYFAALVAEYGPELISTYVDALIVYYPVCFLYFFIAFFAYAFYAGKMKGVKIFFKEIITPSVTALATQSSIATIPANLEAGRRIGIPKDIREIVVPIGATMHMDGTCLSSIFKIAFLFGIYGKEFTGIGTFVSAVVISILGGVVMSGIPGGGLIGEMLIVNMYGFPPEAFPIIAMIGFLVDPPATMVNSTGDTVAAMMVTKHIEGKDWMEKDLGGEPDKV